MQRSRFTKPIVLLALLFAARLNLLNGEEAEPAWVDATGNLGGDEWVKAGPWKLACIPNTGEVIVSMVALGLWSSSDGGATWRRMGADGQRPPDKGQAVHFVFDHGNPKNFWTSGMYGYGVWKTTDGGRKFEKLGPHDHCDGMGVDLADPGHKTLLLGLHEQARSTHKSVDGGKTWASIGDKLPEKTNHSSDPLVLDAKTYLTNTAGWLQGHTWGIYRSEDAGETWTKVSDLGAAGSQLVARDGGIYWPVLWDGAIAFSGDRGKTWVKLQTPVRAPIAEAPGGRIVGVKGTQLFFSADQGKTWNACGPVLPFKPFGLAWCDARRCFFAIRQTNGKSRQAVVRWDLPEDLEKGFVPVRPGALMVWNGEGFSDGNGWMNGGRLRKQTAEKKSGGAALEFHFEGADKAEGGWNWHNWAMTELTDIREYKFLRFAAKFTGIKPAELTVALNCGPNKTSSKHAALAQYGKDLFDGRWHEIEIPLKDLTEGAAGFNPQNTYELRVAASGTGLNGSLFVDDVRFSLK